MATHSTRQERKPRHTNVMPLSIRETDSQALRLKENRAHTNADKTPLGSARFP
jgi:hypothetical protein